MMQNSRDPITQRVAFSHETRMKTREGAATRAWECDALAAHYDRVGDAAEAAKYRAEAGQAAALASQPTALARA